MVNRTTPHPRWPIWAALLTAVLLQGTCAVVSGLDEFELVSDSECAPGVVEACYTGPAGSEDTGTCHGGTWTCGADGQWGTCEGQVVPATEDCTTLEKDEDCDGHAWFSDGDADCTCEPSTTHACYTGPSGTEGVGVCHGGTWTCSEDGLGWGTCELEVTPTTTENCATAEDEDCDGQGWYPDDECVCEPGTVQDCYTGPVGTEDVGACHGGTGICNPDGLTFGQCFDEVVPTAEVCANAVLDEDCSGAPCPGDALWALKATGSGDQIAADLAVDSAGNIIVVGSFASAMTLRGINLTSQGGKDVFVAKLNSTGDPGWVKSFGGSSDQFAMSVAVDATGNIFVAGFFAGSMTAGMTTLTAAGGNDAFVLKFAPNGAVLWAKSFGDADDQRAMGIAVTDQGDPVLTGRFNGLMNFGGGIGTLLTSAGDADVFVARLGSSNGTHIWSHSFGDSAYQRGKSITARDGVYLTGDVRGSFSVGSDIIDAGTLSDVLALKMAIDGTLAWGKSFGGPIGGSDKAGHDIAMDSSGNVLLTGEFNGIIDFGGDNLMANGPRSGFVARFNSAGEHDWSKAFGDSDTLFLVSRGVAADAMNNVLLTGEFSGTADFGGDPLTSAGNDLFVAKLSPNGDHLWSRRFGNAAAQVGLSIAADPAGDVLVAGQFRGTLDFNTIGTSLTANDASGVNNTLFIAKLAK